jgi:hypothetical protein
MAADEVHIMAKARATDTAGLHTHAGKTMIGKIAGYYSPYQVLSTQAIFPTYQTV